MEVLVLFFLIVMLAVVIPMSIAVYFEKKLGGPFVWFHSLVNLSFLSWASYDVLFGYHYPHGPNTLFIIFPAFLGFALVYGVIVTCLPFLTEYRFDRFRLCVTATHLILFVCLLFS
jgi:hypothetical protein